MNKYVFLRINNNFSNIFYNNLKAFLELYYRKDDSDFYNKQFSLFIEKNKSKEIINYLKMKLKDREGVHIFKDFISLENKYQEYKESIEFKDDYLIGNFYNIKSPFIRYLFEYDSDFIVIDLNSNKIERLALVN